jgi:cyclopropane-fatty-acyl-phospholipid synthase
MLPALSPYFELVRLRNDREHYTETFRAWAASLDAKREQAEVLVGKEVVERYRRYHGLFTIGFHTGAMQLLRLTLRRRDEVVGGAFDDDPSREV